MERTLIKLIVISVPTAVLLGLAVLGAGMAGVFSASDRDTPDRFPHLDVPQQASASAEGVTIQTTRAAFSGTGTHVELTVDTGEFEASRHPDLRGQEVERVVIRHDAFATSSLPIVSAAQAGAIRVPPEEAVAVRFGPPDPLRRADVVISALDLELLTGEVVRLTGEWTLPLDYPDDIAARLQTETLSAGDVAVDQGVTIAVEGAIRSVTETLVTVRLETPADLSLLGAPAIRVDVDGQELQGRITNDPETASLVEIAFPPTPFGSDVTLAMGPFLRQIEGEAVALTFDLGRIAQRAGMGTSFGESAAVSPGDVIESTGTGELVGLMISRAGTENMLRLEIEGAAFPGGLRGIVLREAGGEEVPMSQAGTGFRRDATMTIVGDGWTTMSFPLQGGLGDLDGIWTVTTGDPSEVVHGSWSVDLSPVELRGRYPARCRCTNRPIRSSARSMASYPLA